MSDTEDAPQDVEEVVDEGHLAIEELQRRKEQKLKEEMEEYTQMRKEEKEREARELEDMKRKRAERLKERAEEEKRLAEQRKEEDARRKAEEEERKQRKLEEEEKKKQEKERRRHEAEKRMGPKVPNFTIVKKEGDGGSKDDDSEKTPQKTKEELEKEKQATLTQRVTPLGNLSEFSVDQLAQTAKELHDQLRTIVSNNYMLEERYKRGQYDIVEMQERARAMKKTKKRGVSCVQVDDSYDRMNDRFSNAPPKILVANKFEGNLDRRTWSEKVDCYNKKPKILLCSKYERHTDNRSFDERHKLYEFLSAEKPPPEIMRIRKSSNAGEE